MGVPQFKNPILSTPRVHPRLDVNRIICQNLLDFVWRDPVRGNVSFVVGILVILDTQLHVNTLYRHCAGDIVDQARRSQPYRARDQYRSFDSLDWCQGL